METKNEAYVHGLRASSMFVCLFILQYFNIYTVYVVYLFNLRYFNIYMFYLCPKRLNIRIVPIRVPLGVVRNVIPPVHRKVFKMQWVTYWNYKGRYMCFYRHGNETNPNF